MANTGFKGIDVRQTGNQLVFDAFLQNSVGALVTSGTTNLYIMELQSDGTIKTYDFNDNTFKTTACTTEFLGMTYRKSNNATTDTGLWTAILSTLTQFTIGSLYLIRVNNSNTYPTDQMRKFQYGSAEGDLVVTAGTTGQAYVQSDNMKWLGGTIPAVSVTGVPIVDLKYTLGIVSPAAAGFMALDWAHITNVTTTIDFTNTTIKNLDGNTVQTGDSYARIGANGMNLAALAPSLTALSTATWTSGLATSIGTNLDATISSRLATSGYTAPDNADIATILTDVTSILSTVNTNLNATVSSRAPASTALSNAQWTNGRAVLLDHLDLNISAVSIDLTEFFTTDTGLANIDAVDGSIVKEISGNVILSPVGLDQIPATGPSGPASTFREMVIQLWRRFFKQVVKSRADSTIKTYADNGTTVITTQGYQDNGVGDQTLFEA